MTPWNERVDLRLQKLESTAHEPKPVVSPEEHAALVRRVALLEERLVAIERAIGARCP